MKIGGISTKPFRDEVARALAVATPPMRAVVQRVKESTVTVRGEVVGRIGAGLLVLLGVGREDGPADVPPLAEKIVHLRVFDDGEGKMNRSLLDVGGELLVVSQFTLWGDAAKGRRPSFARAASADAARSLYEQFLRAVEALGVPTARGRFQERMDVHLVNDGPVTLLLDTSGAF